jgi:hypothetical protein
VLFCVYVVALRRDDPPSMEPYNVQERETNKVTTFQKRDCRSIDDDDDDDDVDENDNWQLNTLLKLKL